MTYKSLLSSVAPVYAPAWAPGGWRYDTILHAPDTTLDGLNVQSWAQSIDDKVGSTGSVAGTTIATDLSVSDALADIGAETKKPFVILAMGQSNMVGRDTLGDKTIESGIYCTDQMLNATSIISAAYGTSPLNLKAAGAGTTTTVADCCNNQAIAFANALRTSGQIPDDRDIVIVFNCVGGQSIKQWVGSGVTSPYWEALLNSIALVTAKYTDWDINHVIWDQGESDYTGSNTAFSTKATYLTGFDTLYTQLKSLANWTATTSLSTTELGLWSNNTQQDRNDALRTLADGAVYPYVTFVTTEGFTQSLQAPPFHYNGIALQEIGLRHFQAWNSARLYGSFCPIPRNENGGGRALPTQLTLDGTSLTVQPSDLLGGLCVIDATAGGTISLPPAETLSSHNFCAVRILSGTALITLTSTTSINLWNNTSSGNGHIPHNSVVDCFVSPDGSYWKAIGVSPRLGDTICNYLSLSSDTTLTEGMCRGLFLYIGSGTTSLTLPNLFNAGLQSGHSVTIYSSTSCSIVVDGSGSFRYPSSGFSPTTLLAEQYTVIKLVSISGTWVVLDDSEQAPQYYSYTSNSVTLTERECRNSTVYFSNPGTIVLPDVSSSTYAGGYNLTMYVSGTCTISQSGSELFRLAGEGLQQVAQITATASRGILKFTTVNNRWFLLPGSEVTGRQSINPTTSDIDLSGYQVGEITLYLQHTSVVATPPLYPADGSGVDLIFSTAATSITWNGLWSGLSLPSSAVAGSVIRLRYLAVNSAWTTI